MISQRVSRFLSFSAALSMLAAYDSAAAGPGPTVVDLTHTLPTFKADASDPLVPDITKPFPDATATGGESVPIATFFDQVVMEQAPLFPVVAGAFRFNRMVLWEHHGTHIDAPSHFERDPPDDGDVRTSESLTSGDLIGNVVYIDISDRVQAEIDRALLACGNLTCADFTGGSVNNVRAFDIRAVENEIEAGSWVVANLGWSQFYEESGPRPGDPDPFAGPYINGFNFPGFTEDAIRELIDIEDEKGIRINGIAADNIGIDMGLSEAVNEWPAHYMGFPRGWKLVENLAGPGALAFKSKNWILVVGTPKHASGTGGAARVFAIRQPLFGVGVIE